MTDDIKLSYNKFTEFPNLPYNCISYLIDNNEDIWKMLKYSSPDCWKKTNLTRSEKGALIYDGIKNETDCRVFMDIGQDYSWTLEACFLRISIAEVVPSNHIVGSVTMSFEVYSHYKINHMGNYKTRLDSCIQSLLETFNGQDVGGLGRLYFDMRAARTKVYTIGQIPYKGKGLIMCNYMTS